MSTEARMQMFALPWGPLFRVDRPMNLDDWRIRLRWSHHITSPLHLMVALQLREALEREAECWHAFLDTAAGEVRAEARVRRRAAEGDTSGPSRRLQPFTAEPAEAGASASVSEAPSVWLEFCGFPGALAERVFELLRSLAGMDEGDTRGVLLLKYDGQAIQARVIASGGDELWVYFL